MKRIKKFQKYTHITTKKFRLINSRYVASELHGTVRKCFLACKEREDSKPSSKFQKVYFFTHLFVVYLTTLLEPKVYSVELLNGSE